MNDASPRERVLTIMLVAGEPSGDQLGAQLMAGLKALAGDRVRIVGVGGPAMAAQGLQSLFPLDATAVMGLREVVPRIPTILRRVREAADFALKVRPDLVVLIDSARFHPSHRAPAEADRSDDPHRELCAAAGVGVARLSRARDGALFRCGADAASVRGAVFREERI